MLKRSLLVILLIATTSTSGMHKTHGKVINPPSSHSRAHQAAADCRQSGELEIVWAAGTGGTYVVTTDGGSTWKSGVVPGAEALQFRDVQGVSDQVAYLMSIGNNTGDFRIYKTEDAGAHWTIQFKNKTVNAFYDCFAFWTPDRGITHSDSVNGVFPDIRTTDGKTWHSIARNMPPALSGEASFSSSGTCITTARMAKRLDYHRRLKRRTDPGDSGWRRHVECVRYSAVSNANAGGFSVAFRDPWHGIVGGGDLTSNSDAQAATSDNGGQTWTFTTKPPIPGAIFGLAYVRGLEHRDDRSNQDEFGHEHDRTVVITTETQPNFESGAPPGLPMKDKPGSNFRRSAVTGRSLLRIRKPDGSSATTDRFSRLASSALVCFAREKH